jgi:hypothetical protein
MYKIGQKVVCVNDVNLKQHSFIEKGVIYTIKGVCNDGENKQCLLFYETNNGAEFGYPYFFGYKAERFVKIKNIENLSKNHVS